MNFEKQKYHIVLEKSNKIHHSCLEGFSTSMVFVWIDAKHEGNMP
jgi:hypothetical protein